MTSKKSRINVRLILVIEMEALPDDLLEKFLQETSKPEEKEEQKVEIPEDVIVHDRKTLEKMQKESARERMQELLGKTKTKRISAGAALAGRGKNPAPSATFSKTQK